MRTTQLSAIGDIVSLRASSLPLAFKCPGSIRRAGVLFNESSEPAANGTAAHWLFRGLVTDGVIDWDSIDGVCDEFDADSEEVRYLCSMAQRIWPKVRQFFPHALSEVGVDIKLPVDGLVVTGTADIVAISGDEVRGADWKTGWKDANYSHQMKCYLAAILLSFPQLKSGTFTVIWVRDQQLENYTMTQDDAHAWRDKLIKEVVNWDSCYHPGDHCTFCKRHIECDAANALTRSYVASIADLSLDDIERHIMSLSDERCIEVYRKAKMVKRIAEAALDSIKTRTSQGELAFGDFTLRVVEESRRKVDVEKAWPLLQDALSPSELAECITVSLTKVETAIGQKAGRGNGKRAKEAFKAKLELAEAVTEKPFTKLVERRG